jgi:predicted dinucleotide-binding enzyme
MNATADVRVIAVLGAGRVGSTVARGALAAGYRVLVAGSGAPDDIALTVEYMIPGGEARWAADAIRDADLVVLAIPFGRFPSLPLAELDGKLVLDMMNHWQPVDGDLPRVARAASTSEAVAVVVPGARLVKSLNHIGYHEIEEDARPFGAPDRRAVAVASDDPDAARLVSDVIDRLGFDAVPIGPLSRGVHVEPGTALFGARVTAPELHDALQLEPAARIAAA